MNKLFFLLLIILTRNRLPLLVASSLFCCKRSNIFKHHSNAIKSIHSFQIASRTVQMNLSECVCVCVCTTLLIGKAEMISINQSIREKLKTLPLYFFWNLNRSSHWEEPIQSKAPNDIILLIIQMCWSIHQTPPSATVTIDRTIGFLQLLQFIVILLFLFLFFVFGELSLRDHGVWA